MARVALAIAIVLSAAFLGACDGDEAAAPATDGEGVQRSQPAAFDCPGDGSPDPTDNLVCTAPATPEEAGLERCQPPPNRGGGYEVWIRGVPCSEIRRTLARFGGAAGSRNRPGFFRNEYGWVCWSHLEGRYGPVHNICFRDDQTVFYYFG